jgi:hypothetical protein
MKIMNTKHEILSAYLDGELSQHEVSELEKELKFSKELQAKLDELKRIKQLTFSSVKRLPEAPYFETRLAANLNHNKQYFERFRKWIPAISFTALAAVLMIFLKFNPAAIDELVEQQKTNIAGFYQENLKPLFFASDLSNEDVFNFAFSKRLPLDKTNGQYLKLGYDPGGNEFFEINTASLTQPVDNLNKFVSTLKLNTKQKQQVDSILESYADDIQTQVLVNSKNTVAINPNLWNYNKALVADLMSFAKNANTKQFNKLVPAGYFKYNAPEVASMVKQVKNTNDNKYIFFTPDTIFTEKYDFNKDEFKKEMQQAKEEMKKGLQEVRENLKNVKINLRLDSNFAKLKNDPSWNQNFNVYFDSNFCRVQLSKITIPDIQIPDMDKIADEVEKAMKSIPPIIIDMPNGGKMKSYSFKYEFGDTASDPLRVKIPNVDSILKSLGIFGGDSLLYNNQGEFLGQDSLASVFKLFGDSLMFFRKDEFKNQMKQLQKEMERMRQEMKQLRIEIHEDTLQKHSKKTSIEI